MNALLLAAGFGTRLRPLTDRIPKCLVPIHGVPLLGIWLDRVFAAGFERAVVNTHYLAEQAEAFLDARPDRARIDIAFEPELLGTGGTLVAQREKLPGAALVVHADNLSAMDLRAFAEAHAKRPEGALMTMALFDTDAPQTCGIVETDATRMATAFHEKVPDPPGTLANAAVYMVEPEVIDRCAALGKPFVDLSTEIIPDLMGRIYTWRSNGYHRDIGTPEAYARAQAEFTAADLRRLLGEQ